MPIGLWLWWKAWFRLHGPPGGLGEGLRSASVALAAAQAHIAEDNRRLGAFLPPGTRPADYAGWLDFGEDAAPEAVEYRIE